MKCLRKQISVPRTRSKNPLRQKCAAGEIEKAIYFSCSGSETALEASFRITKIIVFDKEGYTVRARETVPPGVRACDSKTAAEGTATST